MNTIKAKGNKNRVKSGQRPAIREKKHFAFKKTKLISENLGGFAYFQMSGGGQGPLGPFRRITTGRAGEG